MDTNETLSARACELHQGLQAALYILHSLGVRASFDASGKSGGAILIQGQIIEPRDLPKDITERYRLFVSRDVA